MEVWSSGALELWRCNGEEGVRHPSGYTKLTLVVPCSRAFKRRPYSNCTARWCTYLRMLTARFAAASDSCATSLWQWHVRRMCCVHKSAESASTRTLIATCFSNTGSTTFAMASNWVPVGNVKRAINGSVSLLSVG